MNPAGEQRPPGVVLGQERLARLIEWRVER